jgi:hypothetical protein
LETVGLLGLTAVGLLGLALDSAFCG